MTAYADTSWWVAYKNASDALHRTAIQFFEEYSGSDVVWTPWQHVEVFNAFRQLERIGCLPNNPATIFICALEHELKLGYWRHVEFSWTEAVRTANALSAVHSRDLTIRGMDLFHVAIACEIGAEQFLTFDSDQADLARAAGLEVWPSLGCD